MCTFSSFKKRYNRFSWSVQFLEQVSKAVKWYYVSMITFLRFASQLQIHQSNFRESWHSLCCSPGGRNTMKVLGAGDISVARRQPVADWMASSAVLILVSFIPLIRHGFLEAGLVGRSQRIGFMPLRLSLHLAGLTLRPRSSPWDPSHQSPQQRAVVQGINRKHRWWGSIGMNIF